MTPDSSDLWMIVGLAKGLVDLLGLDECLELKDTDKSRVHGFLGIHGQKFLVLLALLGFGGVQVQIGDEPAAFLDVGLNMLPGLGDLVVAMMLWQIEEAIFKIDTFVKLDEGMDVLASILVILLCDHVFSDGVLLTKVLQDSLWSDVTAWVSEEPAFSFNLLTLTFGILPVARLHHFALSNIIKRKMV